MKRNFSLKQVVLFVNFAVCVTLCLCLVAFQFIFKDYKFVSNSNSQYLKKLSEIQQITDEYYIGDINETTLSDNVLYGFSNGINDKYSNYTSVSDANAAMDSMYGNNSGIGIQIIQNPNDATIYVQEVHEGSPASDAGLIKGDTITQIDDKSVVETGYLEVLQYIKSLEIGTKATLNVVRNGQPLTLEVTINNYVSQSVFMQIKNDIAYILITEFNRYTTDQFKENVGKAKNSGVKGIVFDLRDNGGGMLVTVYEMLDFLLPEGDLISVKYKNPANDDLYVSDENCIDLPFVVLTNGNTASASELFSQSLKDYEKGITVGSTTYGKGVVQETFKLSDGSLFKCTVAKYYTKSGVCVDGIGVVPDIETKWTDEENKFRIFNGIYVDKDYIAAVKYLNSLNN